MRPTSDTATLESLGVEWVAGNLTVVADVVAAARGTSVIIHGAAVLNLNPKTEKERQAIEDVNVAGTRAVLQAAEAAGVPRVLYVSSTEAVGACTMCDEEAPLAPLHLYGRTKGEAEALVRSAGVEHIIVRLPGLFGPADRYITYEVG